MRFLIERIGIERETHAKRAGTAAQLLCELRSE
jgi:hypothetical protein